MPSASLRRRVTLPLLAGLTLGCTTARSPSTTIPAAPVPAAQPAVVHIDRWQVPHVYADTRAGVARGLGWAQLRAYPEEILRLYAVARGRGAEIWGERYRASDRMVRTLGIPARSEAALAARSPELRAYLDAFVKGMNDYARAHPERIPAPARAVLPIRPTDPLAHAHRIMLAFTLLTGQRPLVVTVDGEVMPHVAGSNLWAIGPARSGSGHAMLLANPHLPWGPPALRFFEAHLVGPDPPLYGVALLGFPVVMTGFNDAIAWAHTVNVIDGADMFELVPQGDGYRLDGRPMAFESHAETIEIRRDDGSLAEETFDVRRSVHGPVVELTDGRRLAVRAGIDDDYGGCIEAWLRMGRARDLASFEAALRPMHLPMFTVGYADRDGHVLYLSAGRIPRRSAGDFWTWREPMRGDRSELVWDELLPYEALPRVVDPPSGFVQNSNSVPWFATLPPPFEDAARSPWLPPDAPLGSREIHGLRMLSADSSISFDDLRRMRHSSRLQRADHVLDDLVLAARVDDRPIVREAAEVLARWDRQATPDSRGAVLFEAWVHRTLGRPAELAAIPWSADDPLTTPRGLANIEQAVDELQLAAHAVRRAFGRLDVAWGHAHRLGDDRPAVGAPDVLGSFHVIEYAPGPDPHEQPHGGDTFVALVELMPDGPHAEVVLAYGNASPAAPFASDQLDLIAAHRLRRPLLDRAEVEAEAVMTVHLDGSTPATIDRR